MKPDPPDDSRPRPAGPSYIDQKIARWVKVDNAVGVRVE